MNYSHYSSEDFALDHSFQAYVQRSNADDIQFWEGWIEGNPDKEKEVKSATEIIEMLKFKEVIVEEDHLDQVISNINHSIDNKEAKLKPTQRTKSFMSIAASISILLASALAFYFYPDGTSIEKPVVAVRYISKHVPYGQKSNLTLSDGTKVKINSGSTFKFPEHFSDTLREVYLTGEAFFEVSKNPDKPFIIHSGNVDTKVLGTSFNIRAFHTDDDVSVAVATGRVKVSLANDHSRSEILIPNQMFVFNKSKDRAIKSECIKLADQLAWKDKKIVFNKSSQQEIIQVLERWYGVKFIIERPLNVGTGYTAHFKENESLTTTLNNMKYTLGFNYQMKGKIVTLN